MYKNPSRLAAFLFTAFISLKLTAQQPYQANWPSLNKYQIPEWYRDAKFGIFIHWGVYSVPAFGSEWYPREMYIDTTDISKHHVAKYGTQNKFGYKDFIPEFKAAKFDPAQWADLFKRSGAKYIVPVAEHHDGFAMYNTSLSKWNAFRMGPHRDIVGELADAVRAQGLIFGVSSHRIEHWWFMHEGKKFNSDVNDPQYADFYGPAMDEKDSIAPEYMNDWLLRCTELVNKYHPQLFWFDWWIGQPAMEPYRKSFAAYYYNQSIAWNKGVVLNYKYTAYPDSAAVLDIERGKLAGIRPLAWQTDDAVGFKSWGNIEGETYKSPQYIIDELIDVVSKNGNLLLNIGPRSDGTIPEEQQQLLLEIGKWLAQNGEAIYQTRPWKIFGEGPTENVGGSFIDDKVKAFTPQDIRFTTKQDTLYCITLEFPATKSELLVKSLSLSANNGTVAEVMVPGSGVKIKWSQTKDGLKITMPEKFTGSYAAVFKVLFKK